MQSEEEDLVRTLSARLSGEIENLPKDGNSHTFTVKIKGNRGHINLGHQTFDIKTAKAPPPHGNERARDCPQCEGSTWRYTERCMHCHYNLHSHDDVTAHVKKQAKTDSNNLKTLKVAVFCLSVAVLSLYVRDYLPGTFKLGAMGFNSVLTSLRVYG